MRPSFNARREISDKHLDENQITNSAMLILSHSVRLAFDWITSIFLNVTLMIEFHCRTQTEIKGASAFLFSSGQSIVVDRIIINFNFHIFSDHLLIPAIRVGGGLRVSEVDDDVAESVDGEVLKSGAG